MEMDLFFALFGPLFAFIFLFRPLERKDTGSPLESFQYLFLPRQPGTDGCFPVHSWSPSWRHALFFSPVKIPFRFSLPFDAVADKTFSCVVDAAPSSQKHTDKYYSFLSRDRNTWTSYLKRRAYSLFAWASRDVPSLLAGHGPEQTLLFILARCSAGLRSPRNRLPPSLFL